MIDFISRLGVHIFLYKRYIHTHMCTHADAHKDFGEKIYQKLFRRFFLGYEWFLISTILVVLKQKRAKPP